MHTVIRDRDVLSGVIHTIDFDPLHPSTDALRVFYNDVIGSP
jgi:hypothetical protein